MNGWAPGELPQFMDALVSHGMGDPDVLAIEKRPLPQIQPGEILVRTAFAGINRSDCNTRRYGPKQPQADYIFGLEAAGVVAAIGKDVTDWALGDRAAILTRSGACADYVAVGARLALQVPSSIALRDCAALPEAVFTSWLNLADLCALKPGETLLVHGGSSGLGVIAMQVGALMGARVLATAGSDAKREFALKNGAQIALNYNGDDFVPWVLDATHGRGADVIFDMAGGLYAERNLRALALDGRITHLSSRGGALYSAPLRLLMEKRARITGAALGLIDTVHKIRLAREIREHVWPAVGDGLRPAIDSVHEIEAAHEAHRKMEARENLGKILLSTSFGRRLERQQ